MLPQPFFIHFLTELTQVETLQRVRRLQNDNNDNLYVFVHQKVFRRNNDFELSFL